MTINQTFQKTLQNLHINFDQSDLDAVVASFNPVSFSGKSPIIADYQRVIADYFGTSHALACVNGTVAIELALRGLGLRAGDKVALPPTAPIMTILPIITMGCEPVFCDVSPTSFVPDLDHLLTLVNQGLKAIIVVPMWGYPLDMTPVAAFCKQHGIWLIEDCAHAFGIKADGKYIGTFGDVSTFSTHERKLVSTGEGGFCLTNNDTIQARMMTWQHHGLAVSKRDGVARLGEDVGTNFRISPLCAALGINQFGRLDRKIAQRRERVDYLRSALSSITEIEEFPRFNNEDINGYAMVYRSRRGSSKERAKMLSDYGIISDTTRYDYKPLYQEPAFQAYANTCPNAEAMINTIFTIPCHEGLNDADLDFIVETVSGVFSTNNGHSNG